MAHRDWILRRLRRRFDYPNRYLGAVHRQTDAQSVPLHRWLLVAFLPYLVPIIALMIGTGIGAGNLLFCKSNRLIIWKIYLMCS
jgi:hypothetical protein